jgi:hypothetical protein
LSPAWRRCIVESLNSVRVAGRDGMSWAAGRSVVSAV